MEITPPCPLILLAAPELCAALRRGAVADVEERLAALAPPPGAGAALLEAAVGYVRAQLRRRRLESDQAAQQLGQVARRFQALGRAAEAAYCLGEQALCLALCHRPDEAQQALLRAEELLSLVGNEARVPMQSLCQLALGWSLVARGALVEALGAFEQALGGARGDLRGPCLLGLAQALRLLAQGERARRCVEEAAREARGAADPLCEGIALGQLALCALTQGQAADGHQHALRQLALAQSLGDEAAMARARVILAEALLQLGRPADALREALGGLGSAPGQPPLLGVYGELLAARALLAQGAAWAEAAPHLARAEALLGGRDMGTALLLHRACLALLLAHRGDLGGLRAADADALQAMRRVPVPGVMADVFGLLGRAFRVARSPLRAAARERRAVLCRELLAEGAAPAVREVALVGPLGRAAQRTLLLRALTYDEEARPAMVVLVRCPPAQREALLRCAAELRCASAGQLGPLMGLVLEPGEQGRAPDQRLMALRAVAEVQAARVVPLRGVLTDLGELVLDSPGWAELLGG